MSNLLWNSIIIALCLISAVGSFIFINKVNKRKQEEWASQEPLLKDEKIKVWILLILNPVLAGAILYFGLRKRFPIKAKNANKISFIAYIPWIVIAIWRASLWVNEINNSFSQIAPFFVEQPTNVAVSEEIIEETNKFSITSENDVNFSILQKNKEVYKETPDGIEHPRMFVYKNDRYFIIPTWLGGMGGTSILYFYVIDNTGNLREIGDIQADNYNIFEGSDHQTDKDLPFYVQKNGKAYLTFESNYSPDGRTASRVFFKKYYRLENYNIVSYAQDFKEEYLKEAFEAEKVLNASDPEYSQERYGDSGWAMTLIRSVLNYLLAGETEKATDLFDKHFSEFMTALSLNIYPDSSSSSFLDEMMGRTQY
ncbi:MAG: hypothetical protein NTY11_00145 [Candidatus Parcubacteria bacterium]|nr:hypothetical protein [Candidatus Parcubacteria bacterium]